jgi:hypothetical protein
VWGCHEWDDALTIEQNVYKSLKALHTGLNIGRDIKLDGFLFEVRGKQYGDNLDVFGDTVRRVLTAISDHDPNCDHPMDSDIIDKRGWRFLFDDHGVSYITSYEIRL